MLDGDCGIVPVLEDGKLVGVVTDRDICIALATRDERASEIIVGEDDALSRPLAPARPRIGGWLQR